MQCGAIQTGYSYPLTGHSRRTTLTNAVGPLGAVPCEDAMDGVGHGCGTIKHSKTTTTPTTTKIFDTMTEGYALSNITDICNHYVTIWTYFNAPFEPIINQVNSIRGP
ncbi:hypothetical protein DPMN_113781 [Dreissena polymorpha]|uniref:Uncharacterized protein n=1 Tax=Dreissena polymorpha TaxID=45954 RepID=A0A9D4KIX8_DREPO|nr:hypothetical protein DPMN_113781 [Dreissena polymorpha]